MLPTRVASQVASRVAERLKTEEIRKYYWKISNLVDMIKGMVTLFQNIYNFTQHLDRKLKKNIPGIRIECSIPTKANRIIVEDMKKIIFKLAEEKLNEGYSDICILKEATKILRRRTQKFMKTLREFSGSVAVKPNEKNYRYVLCSFLKWLVSGNRELKEELDIKVKVQLETIFANIYTISSLTNKQDRTECVRTEM